MMMTQVPALDSELDSDGEQAWDYLLTDDGEDDGF